MNETEDLSSRSEDLDKKLEINPIEQEIEALVEGGRRMQRIIRILAVVVTVQVILVSALAYGGWRVNQLAKRTSDAVASTVTNRQFIRELCVRSNDERMKTITLWEFVIGLSERNTDRPRTEGDRTRTKEFREFLQRTFAPQKCPSADKLKTGE